MDTTTFLIIIIIVLLLAPIFTAHDIRSSLPENLSGWLAVANWVMFPSRWISSGSWH